MLLLRWTLLLLVLLASSATRVRAEPLDEALYAQLLDQYTAAVSDTAGTRVDYAGLAEASDWKRLIRSLSRVEPHTLTSRDEQLAFWINAYNILAIDLVLQHYPVESIRDIGSLFRPVWNREAGRIGGEGYSLGQIEHQILRPMGEPRIHLAIVCASTSCPSLRREPFSAVRLDAQLDDSTRAFLASTSKGLLAEALGIRVSKIFDWFEDDFEGGGGATTFIRRHAPTTLRPLVEGRLRYLDYDWSLNALQR